MHRRDFIIKSAGLSFTLMLPSLYACSPSIEYDPSWAEPQSLGMIWDTKSILSIGESYLKGFPKENDEQTLVRWLFKQSPLENDALRSWLEQKIKQDFTNNETIMLDGWMLSRTEARQCALFSILESQTQS
ncbi:MAG: hypothetical protein AAFU64_18875 [Bacteroidota bacterium]